MIKGEYQKKLLKFFSVFGVFFFCILFNTTNVSAIGENINANGYSVQTAYDVNDVYVEGGKIHIRGWYIAKQYQNYASSGSTHEYSMTISGINKTYYDLNDYASGDITSLENSYGKSYCNPNVWGKTGVNLTCNYYYNDVGFHFAIPLSDFNEAIKNGNKNFYFIIHLNCKNSSAGNKTFSQQLYVTKNRLGNSGISLNLGNGYFGSLSSNLEVKTMIVQSYNAYVKTSPGKNGGKPKYNNKFLFWGENYWYTNRGYAGNYDNSDWYTVYYSGADWQQRRDGISRYAARNANGGSTGYIPTVYFTLENMYSGDNYALNVAIHNSKPTISTSNQTYYSGQKLTKNMILSSIYAHDNEDGDFVLNGDNNKLSISLSSSSISFSGEQVNTEGLAGTYTMTATVKDLLGATSSENFTITFIQNTGPEFTGISNNDYRTLYVRNYNLKTSDILSGVAAYDKHDGDLTGSMILRKSGEIYKDTIDRRIPGIYDDFTLEVKDIPLIDRASHTLKRNGNNSETNKFSVDGGRNYQITVPTSKYRIVEYNSNGSQIRDSGWINKTSGTYANSYTTRSNTTSIKIMINTTNTSVGNSISFVRDYWAQNVSITTKFYFTQEVKDYFPPELSTHEYYYFEGYDVTQEEILKDIQIKDSRYDVNEIRKTLKITNWSVLNKDVVGDYYLQATATNAGIDENPDLAEEKYTGYLTITVHIVSKDDQQFQKGSIRYINKKYFSTLKEESTWFKTEVLTNRLRKTLEKNTDTQDDKNIVISFQFTGKDIKTLKTYINEHGKSIFTSDFNKLFFNKLLAFTHDGNLEDSWIKIDGYWCYQHFDKNNKATLYTSCWKDIDGARYYFDENGHIATGQWQTIDDVLYYFTSDGSLAKGWTLIDGKWYYFNEEYQRVTGFYKINGDTYYFDVSGVKTIGWLYINGVQYYFGETGAMYYDGIYNIEGKSFIFMEDGSVPYNLVHYKGKIYYVDAVKGVIKNEIKTYEEFSYLFGPDGEALKGWQDFNDSRYLINEDYHICKNMFGESDGKIYYFTESGALYTITGILRIDNKIYYVQDDYTILTSVWMTFEGFKYYFGETGTAETGMITIDGEIYYFSTVGTLQTNLWFEDYYFGADGKAVEGIINLPYVDNGVTTTKTYYFKNHKVCKNEIIEIDDKKYYFNENGHRTSGFILYNEEFYYFDEITDVMVKNKSMNFVTDYYYFGADGKAIKNTWKTINGNQYYYTADARRARGVSLVIDNNNYYFKDDGLLLRNGILGQWFYGDDGIGQQLIKSYVITGINKDTTIEEGEEEIEDDIDTAEKVQVGIFDTGRMIIAGSGNTVKYNINEFPEDEDLTEEEKTNYIVPPWLNDFYEDKNGKQIPLKEFIQSVEFIDEEIQPESLDYWFTNCSKLEEVKNLPTSVKSMYRTFDGATKLSKVPDLNAMTNLENMELAFNNCQYLTKTPLLPNSVMNMNKTFANNTFLSEISNIPSSVKTMNGTFMGCTNLTAALDLPNTVEDMSDIYNGCSNLKTSGAIPENAILLDRAYANTPNLQGTLYIKTSSLVSYADIFKGSATKKSLILYGIGSNKNIVDKIIETVDSTSLISLGTKFVAEKINVKKGETAVIVIYSNIKDAKYTYEIKDKTIASVSTTGIVTGVKVGITTITITETGGKTATCTVEVIE